MLYHCNVCSQFYWVEGTSFDKIVINEQIFFSIYIEQQITPLENQSTNQAHTKTGENEKKATEMMVRFLYIMYISVY